MTREGVTADSKSEAMRPEVAHGCGRGRRKRQTREVFRSKTMKTYN